MRTRVRLLAAIAVLLGGLGVARVVSPAPTAQDRAAAAPELPLASLPPPRRAVPGALRSSGPPRRVQPPRGQSQASRRAAAPTTIVIPRLGIRAPVLERGVDAAGHLPIAPGYSVTHLSFSAAPGQQGNAVVYGHDDIEGSVFRFLPDLQPGDRIYVAQGTRRFVYQVTGRKIVPPTDLSVLQPTAAPTLTLISCTPYDVDTQRIVVSARLAMDR